MRKLSSLLLALPLIVAAAPAICGGACCRMQVTASSACHETADRNRSQNDCCGGCSFKSPWAVSSPRLHADTRLADFFAAFHQEDVLSLAEEFVPISDFPYISYFPSPPSSFSSRAPPL